MLNNRKVRLMTKLAIYEKKEGKEDIKLAKYYKSDYARLNVLKTAVAVTIAFIFICALVVIYRAEYIIANAFELDYAQIGKEVLGVYLVLMAVYLILTMLGYSLKYAASRKKLARYFRMLRKLNHMYLIEDGYVKEDSDDAAGSDEEAAEDDSDEDDDEDGYASAGYDEDDEDEYDENDEDEEDEDD